MRIETRWHLTEWRALAAVVLLWLLLVACCGAGTFLAHEWLTEPAVCAELMGDTSDG